MASLVTYNERLRRIEFSLTPNGKRRNVRLGRINAKAARSILAKVEAIIADKMQSRPHDADVSQWLASLDEKLLSRLRAVGLADGIGVTQTTLGDFLGRYMKTIHGKPATLTFYGHTKRNLLDYFTAGRLLADITEADADAWRAWLVDNQGLSIATVARRVVAARTFWRKAIRWKLTNVNPFEGVHTGSQLNESRKHFVSADMIRSIIDSCPDVEWRLLIGLSRWGGLRCPSEHLSLTWADVDWNADTLRVRSIKTEHHDGHAVRIVPLFPELRDLLMDAFDAAEPGVEHVITRYRDKTQNLGTQFKRIIKRAGYEPWPRLWQNLRASRESELMRDYDLTTVCRWIGNSPAVAAKHYAMSIDLDADFRRAIGEKKAQQKAQQSPSDGHGLDMTRELGAHEKTPEKQGFDQGWQELTNTVNSTEWAVQDLNL
ncbi:MAG TPA: hypothetical protein DCM28_03865 [Phycisphaerales bacterium]|nr:hypothetical protein [Phycisphaerales bacterium]|tara:strand:+ start:39053 stop:40345 length:1293 start_codon:yes stop_codon:yes gene_type:complete